MFDRCSVKFILVLLIFLGGCSESVPPDDDGSSSDPVTLVETNYLPYEVLDFSTAKQFSSSLGLIDAQNPRSTSVPSVTSTGSEVQILAPRFNQGTFTSLNTTLSDYRLNTLLFSQDNQLYKIDLFNVIEPNRVQLSSEFQVNTICHEWDIWVEDFASFTNSRYVYYIASDCQSNNGEWHMVNLAMTGSQTPINLQVNINYFITSVLESGTGALKGWLAVNQNNLLIYFDSDFIQSTLVTLNNNNTLVSNRSAYLISNSQNQFLIAIDEKIVWYNPQNNLLENSLEVFPAAQLSEIDQWRSDGTYLYFTLKHFAADANTVLTSSLHRVLLENATQIEILSNSESAKIDKMEIGSDGVSYSVSGLLKQYSATTSLITTFSPPENYSLSLDAQSNPVFFVSGSMLLIEYSRIGNLSKRLVKVMDTNRQINETLMDSYIVGGIFEKSWQSFKSRRVEKLVLESQGASLGSRVISALEPAAYPLMLTLGQLPIDSNPRPLERFYALGHDDILIQGTFDSVVELFFIDAEKESSLEQVTNNQTTERVVNF